MGDINKNCRRFVGLINASVDGSLGDEDRRAGDEDRRALERHIAECPSCAREVAVLGLTVRLISEIPTEEPPPGFDGAVLTAVRRARAEAGEPGGRAGKPGGRAGKPGGRAGKPAVGAWSKVAAWLGALTAAICAAGATETVRSALPPFVRSLPGLAVDAWAAAKPLSGLAAALGKAFWVILSAAINATGPITERLALEQGVVISALALVVAVYYAVRRLGPAPLRVPTI